MPDNFVHLHGHSEYSLLDGYSKLPKLIAKVKELEQPAIALTDHGSLSGIHKFYKTCKNEGVNGIVGYEAYLATQRLIKTTAYRKTTHLLLLAKSKKGYQNLIKIASNASGEGFYYKPRVDLDLLRKYKEGLICTTACIASQFNQYLLAGQENKAIEHLVELQGVFGEDVYIELQNHGIPEQELLLSQGLKIAKILGVKTLVTNDYHYVEKKDHKFQDIIFCDQLKADINDPNRLKLNNEHHIKTRAEMQLAVDQSEALDNTVELAGQCNINLTSSGYVMPKVENEEQQFDRLIKKGVFERFEFLPESYVSRLDHELKVIKDANLMGYFLTVADYINWAKDNDLMVGPGRGSVAGSLVAYLLKIHDVDPMKYNLLFSRFYNPGRKKSLPDVDTDFGTEDVDKVIEYVSNKYGKEHVAHTGTFQKVAGKGAIKLVCRVSNIPFDVANKYSSLVDSKKHKRLSDALESSEFKRMYEADEQFHRVVDDAMEIENTAVSQGVHAAGVLISSKPLDEVIPVRIDKKTDTLVSCWDMEDVESAGLIKYDFLSIGTLDVIRDCMKLAGLDYRYTDIPLDDDKAYDLISTTTNIGIFQLSSSGISHLANQMVVKSIEDIAVVSALYRPGPLGSGMDLMYLKRRFGNEAITYIHEKTIPALESTLGVLIFQEQVTRICMDLAGFSEEEADEMRKMMGKKLIEQEGGKEKLRRIGNNFANKCAENGVSKSIAKIVWDQLQKFGGYGFNLSHATSYGLLTYYTAYLKAHHPVEFMTALLNNAVGNPDKMKMYLTECKRLDIEIVPPNHWHPQRFTSQNWKILFGLGAIKGVSTSACEKIDKRRFDSFIEFCKKVKPETDMLIALIEAGALDSLEYTRRTKLLVAESLMSEIRANTRKVNPKQKTLFSQKFDYKIENIPEFTEKKLSIMQLDRLGVFLGTSPLEEYKDFARKHTLIPDEKDIPYNQSVRVLCIPIKVKTFLTKSTGQEMAICSCETLGSAMELLVFPKSYTKFKDKIRVGVPILVEGKVASGEQFSLKTENIDLME